MGLGTRMRDIPIRVQGLSKRYRSGGPQARYRTIRETMKAMGAQGKARVEEHFTWGKVSESVIEGYHKVL